MAEQRREDEARLASGENRSEEFIHHYEKPSMDGHSMSSSQVQMTEKGPVTWAVRPEEFFNPNWKPTQLQKIVAESIILAGGGVAILLQVANPGVA